MKIFSNRLLEGQTFLYETIINNESGTPINITLSAQLTSLVFTLFNADTLVSVGDRLDQDCLDAPSVGVYPGVNDHTLHTNGTLSFRATEDDTADAGTYIGRYVYVFPDAQSVARTGIHEFTYTVEALDTVT